MQVIDIMNMLSKQAQTAVVLFFSSGLFIRLQLMVVGTKIGGRHIFF